MKLRIVGRGRGHLSRFSIVSPRGVDGLNAARELASVGLGLRQLLAARTKRAHHAMTAVHGGREMLLGICPASPRSAPGPGAAYLLRRSRSERLGVSFVVGTGSS